MKTINFGTARATDQSIHVARSIFYLSSLARMRAFL
ncbi:hypothetical protein BTH_I2682 [Burkholderia thailandensis E264]|uniref:Uncharacterized protein n=1 Tax=Burkholderia thailandensis (strain ATCC 700388 / DSM 13276 / CCUG 48851 / CIP 106301 / E264) TaxID=271848 RepID=Q2SV52_BURTA|nr:hypothetical protein BTH_I2682 [Burkholderia thailandensis E264]